MRVLTHFGIRWIQHLAVGVCGAMFPHPLWAAEGTPAIPAAAATPLQQEKETRTAAQQKLDSHIVLALKKSRGEPPFDKPTPLDPDLAIGADGRVLVDIKATVSPELLALIASGGGKIINSFASMRAIRALVPLARLESLAARADVQFIAPAAVATTNPGQVAPASPIRP